MSRSNPTTNTPNPCTRFFDWAGGDGNVNYYDKTTKKKVVVEGKFTFLVLDELATIKGYHEESNSGIWSNEVRDTRIEPMNVKAFNGGPIAAGLYANIKDKVVAAGGGFATNCYIAYKDDSGKLALGSLMLKGAALSSWFDFKKTNRADIYKQAVTIDGYTEGKKGKIVYRMPIFKLTDISEKTNNAALALDKELQAYLTSYFERATVSGVARDAVGDSGHFDAIDPPPPDTGEESPFTYDAKPTNARQQSRQQPAPVGAGNEEENMDDIPF